MKENAQWVKQTIAGDERGFHRLIIKYQSAIRRLILSRVLITGQFDGIIVLALGHSVTSFMQMVHYAPKPRFSQLLTMSNLVASSAALL